MKRRLRWMLTVLILLAMVSILGASTLLAMPAMPSPEIHGIVHDSWLCPMIRGENMMPAFWEAGIM